ncbi:MAG TPA: DUF92 domain-containing protein [Niabella sp.]|nr:DUF92 domain-containing protein [Niabella sp.]
MNISSGIFLFIIITGTILSILLKKLTIPAAITGALLSYFIYLSTGFPGIIVMAAFFVTGVWATSWKMDIKLKAGLAEKGKGKRTTGQVFANAGLPAIIGLTDWLLPSLPLHAPIIIASCFSAATADTVSSELGNVYGRRFYNILNFQKDEKGSNGVVSLEGSLLGLAGSLVIALLYIAFNNGLLSSFVIIVVAGTAGNIADSVCGATLERKGWLNNNAVNFLNTSVAAITAWTLSSFSGF